MKKAVALLLAALMVFALVACGNTSTSAPAAETPAAATTEAAPAAEKAEEPAAEPAGDPINIKLNTSWGENCTVQEGALKFADLCAEKSNGRITVKVYPSNQLASGNQQTSIEMIQNGDIEMSLSGMTVLSFLDDRLAVINMPFLFPNYEVADELLYNEEAESRQMLDAVMVENGLIPVAYGEAGYRQLTNNKVDIHSPEDMNGLKFRILTTCPMFFDLYNALYANPTGINMSEVFTSLQQGVVDGQENAVDTAKSYKLNEVQKYLTCWNGVYDAVAFIASPVFMDGLSAEDQVLIYECAEEAMAFQKQRSRESEEEVLALFEETMTITKLTDEEIDAFRVAVAPVYDKWVDLIGLDLLTAFGYKA